MDTVTTRRQIVRPLSSEFGSAMPTPRNMRRVAVGVAAAVAAAAAIR